MGEAFERMGTSTARLVLSPRRDLCRHVSVLHGLQGRAWLREWSESVYNTTQSSRDQEERSLLPDRFQLARKPTA